MKPDPFPLRMSCAMVGRAVDIIVISIVTRRSVIERDTIVNQTLKLLDGFGEMSSAAAESMEIAAASEAGVSLVTAMALVKEAGKVENVNLGTCNQKL